MPPPSGDDGKRRHRRKRSRTTKRARSKAGPPCTRRTIICYALLVAAVVGWWWGFHNTTAPSTEPSLAQMELQMRQHPNAAASASSAARTQPQSVPVSMMPPSTVAPGRARDQTSADRPARKGVRGSSQALQRLGTPSSAPSNTGATASLAPTPKPASRVKPGRLTNVSVATLASTCMKWKAPLFE